MCGWPVPMNCVPAASWPAMALGAGVKQGTVASLGGLATALRVPRTRVALLIAKARRCR
jgi:hypothetical protein